MESLARLDRWEEISKVDLKRSGKLDDHIQCRVSNPSLYPTDVGTIESRTIGEFLLGPTPIRPKRTQPRPKVGTLRIRGHALTVPLC